MDKPYVIYPQNEEKIKAELAARYHENEQPTREAFGERAYVFRDKSRIDVYKTGTIKFIRRHADYCELREMDLRWTEEPVEEFTPGSPKLCSLNFERAIIGSDEVGTGELFRSMVVTAAYIPGVDEVRKYIAMGVGDSKEVKGKIDAIGRELTGIGSWQEIMDKPLLSNDVFAARIITNEEYNQRCHENNDRNVKAQLMKESHIQLLQEVYKKHPNSIIVVDDFTGGHGVKDFKETLSNGPCRIPTDRIYMTKRGDAKLMAISLASVISRYLSNLAFEYAQKRLNDTYQLESEEAVKLPATLQRADEIKEFLAKLKPELRDEFLDKFCKKYYDNIWRVLKG